MEASTCQEPDHALRSGIGEAGGQDGTNKNRNAWGHLAGKGWYLDRMTREDQAMLARQQRKCEGGIWVLEGEKASGYNPGRLRGTGPSARASCEGKLKGEDSFNIAET